MLPIVSIAKLLVQLATITPVANDSIDNIRKLIDTVRKPGAGTQNQLDNLKKAIELQLIVNREINDKLNLIGTVLQTVQKSLKILAVTVAGIGLIAVAALVVALLK
jgi:predicted PurR-regulated permease PerM